MYPSSITKSILTTLLKGSGIAFLFIMPTAILAMDTDIFAINTGGTGQAPNVLIVLDNTSNWSRQSQQWPDGASQGQSEVNAIKMMLQDMQQNVNVGLMEFVTGGTSGDSGGYIRQAVLPMGPEQDNGPANKAAFTNKLTTIFNNINSPDEKKNSGQPYGNLMYDAYNYFAGTPPFASSSSVITSLADSAGYTTKYSLFKSPLSTANSCGITSTYIIFISNPNSSGPSADDAANTAALSSLGGSTKQILLPNFTTTETNTTTTKDLGLTPSCYSNLNTCSTASYAAQCANYTSCVCSSSTTSSAGCGTNKLKYMVQGNLVTTSLTITETNTTTVDSNPFNADEWARFMYQKGIPIAGGGTQTVATYAIDVYNAQPNALHSSLMMSMATNGGGKYFSAKNERAIVDALKTIFSEIMAVNTTFASASLPISATNRAQNENQIYIGMFRPGIGGLPRWTGNLKRYKMANIAGRTDLADINNNLAVSSTTGFISHCATSWWSTDSGNYWASVTDGVPSPRIFITQTSTPGLSWTNVGDYVNLGKGLCSTAGANAYSDSPDGAIVEKGGAAQMLRNNSSRNIKTLSGTSLVDFNTTNVTTLSADTTINNNIVNFIRGADVTGEINKKPSSSIRPTLHGDVIHSRPLPIDHGGNNTGVVVYYGSNDGTYRAVKASDGSEIWSFVAPEFYSNLQGLLDNSPLISSSTPKKFFFDGATGLFNRANSDPTKNSTTWIYPSMRRGGRMIYAFDVSDPTSPKLKWKVGCTNQNDDAGCTDTDPSFKHMGQTWSTPIITYLKGYLDSTPVVIFGGGYDTCEDSDVSPVTAGFCSNPKGAAIYILNADTGSLIKAFTTPITRSIAADISLVDVNYDGQVDIAYAADTGGNIYRINFTDPASNFAALEPDKWTISRAAYTNGAGRKFLFTPALLPYQNQVFLAIGTGDREHPLISNYPFTTPITNRFYVYLDDPTRTTAINLDGSNMLDHTNADDTDCDTTKISPDAVDGDGNTLLGWRMDLNQYGSGEQTVTSAIIHSSMVAFSTNRPVSSDNSCTYALGEARGYWVNLLNGSGAIGAESTESCGGSRSSKFIGGGLPPSPVTGTVNIDGHLTNVVIGAAQIDGGESAPISGQKAKAKIKPNRKRTYWNASGDTR